MGKVLAILPVVFLSGCAAPVLIMTGVSATSVAVNETTGRTATDHIVSGLNGRDCRLSRTGREDICQDEVVAPKLQITNTGVTPSSTQEIEARYR